MVWFGSSHPRGFNSSAVANVRFESPGHFDQIFVPDALDSSMNFLARGLVLFGLSLLATSVFAQSEPDAAILKVNGQEVFQSDLELVKSMLRSSGTKPRKPARI
jgi:hypothetical protein